MVAIKNMTTLQYGERYMYYNIHVFILNDFQQHFFSMVNIFLSVLLTFILKLNTGIIQGFYRKSNIKQGCGIEDEVRCMYMK